MFALKTGLLKVFQRGIDDDAANPALERTFKLELNQVIENLDEGILQNIFGFQFVPGITASHRKHLPGESPEQLHLAAAILPDTPFDQLFLGQMLEHLRLLIMTPEQGFSLLCLTSYTDLRRDAGFFQKTGMTLSRYKRTALCITIIFN